MLEKRIYLSALNIEAPIPPDVHFHDEGFVQDLNMHFVMKAALYAVARHEVEEVVKNRTIFGRTVVFRRDNQRYIYMACCKNNDEVQRTQTRGHEETHVLQLTGNFHLFEELVRRAKLKIDFRRLENHVESLEELTEVTADIGGLFVCHKKFGFERVIKHYKDIAKQFQYLGPAFEIYRSAVHKSLPLMDRWVARIAGLNHAAAKI